MRLSNGNKFEYGTKDLASLESESYNFAQGKQLLGIHGKVAYEPQNVVGDTLLTLGFFRDECSATRELYRTQADREEEFERRHGTHTLIKVVIALVIMFVIVSTCLMCYCGLKNRGKCCFKKT